MFFELFNFLIGLNNASPAAVLCVFAGFLNTLLLSTGTPSYAGVFPMDTFDLTGLIVAAVDFEFVATGLAIPVPDELLKTGS